MGSRRTTPTAPLRAAVVSEATEAPTNTPWLQSKAWRTSGAVRARRPPNTSAAMGTPCGSSNLGEIDGHCAAGAVNREFGCAPFCDGGGTSMARFVLPHALGKAAAM